MRLTIFSRLVIGFIIIFLLQMAASLYVSMRLHPLERIPNTIKNTDYKLILFNKKLTDILMSQMRYEKKIIITRDATLYNHFIENKNNFNQYLEEMQSIARSTQAESLLSEIEQAYGQYQSVFDEEIQYLKAEKRYPQKEYKQKKEEALSIIIEKLKKLTAHTEQSTYERIEKLGEAVADTRKVTIMISLSSFVLGIIISIFVTRGIVKPLSVVKQKTQRIALGDFNGDLKLLSPPEVKDLANTINMMCYNLKQIDRIKTDFFASMSHELRTPLTSIKEGINLLREKAEKETGNKQQRLLAIMAEESNRLIELINSFLDLSKMEAGMMRYTFFPEDITPLIYQAINGIEPLAQAKNITIEAQLDSGLPVVRMDSERILQVLRNLLGNAVKFTPPSGHVKVMAIALKHGLGVAVSDTGEGIAEDDLKRIFDKFQQGSNVQESNNIGTGLGLSIVKHIIDAHGGKVWAKSKKDVGSTFVFVLSS
jgi:two-component system sensor histidine kinase GlrK